MSGRDAQVRGGLCGEAWAAVSGWEPPFLPLALLCSGTRVPRLPQIAAEHKERAPWERGRLGDTWLVLHLPTCLWL